MSLLMDALKKAEKEKKEAAKRRNTGQNPVLKTGEHPIDQDDTLLSTTSTQVMGSDDETQEVSVSMELQSMDDTLTSQTSDNTFSTTQIDNTIASDETQQVDMTVGDASEGYNVDDLDLDLNESHMEDTQLMGDMTDESIIERTIESELTDDFDTDIHPHTDFENTDEFIQEHLKDEQEPLPEEFRAPPDEKTLGLRLETLENDREQAAEGEMTIEGMETQSPPDIEQPAAEIKGDPTLEREVTDLRYRSNLGDISDPSLEMEALDSVSATQMMRDIGTHEGQPTPVAASTVFAASRNEKRGGKYWIGGLVVVALAALAFVGLLIQRTITPEVPKVVSPIVAKGVEAEKSTAITDLSSLARPANPDQTDSTTQTSASNTSQEAQTAAATETGTPDLNSSQETVYISDAEDTVTAASEDMDPIDAIDADPEQVTVESIPGSDKVAMAEPAVTRRDEPVFQEQVMSPIASPIAPAMIKISKGKASRPQDTINRQAYDAYKQGQYDVAASMYQVSLKKKPDNRDALLGLAAVNLKTGNERAAYDLYRRVLKIDPQDPVARVSVLNLRARAGAANNETALKNLIQATPDAPDLYFSLGTVYSKQQRWPEAQQAFFDAYTRQSNNPDYAANLAISLDHMGQTQAALDYYRIATDLAKSNPASFDSASLRARMDAIMKQGG